MRKRIGLVLLAMALVVTASAQTFQLKVGGGFASQYTDKKLVGSFKAGIGYEYEFDQHWTFNPSLLFVGKGWKDKDQMVPDFGPDGEPKKDENGQIIMSRMGRSVAANYLELPLVINYYLRLGESRYIVLGAGPYVACGLMGKVKTKGDGRRQGAEKLYYEEDTFELPGARRFDAGIQAQVGYQLPKGITVGVEADFGLTRYHADGGRNLSGLVSLTYAFGH